MAISANYHFSDNFRGPVPSPGVLCPCRWLGYLGLLLLDVAICLLVLVGLIRSSKGILVG